MKIVDLRIERDNQDRFVAMIAFDNGEREWVFLPWQNDLGKWASPSMARDPEEIAARLRQVAATIEGIVKVKKAA